MATIQQRTTSDGSVRYRALVRIKGRPVQSRTFRRKTDANRWAQRVEADLRRGIGLHRGQAERRTFADLLERYRPILAERVKPSEFHRRCDQLDWWSQHLGRLALATLRPTVIADLRQSLREGSGPTGKPVGPATANRYLAALSAALAYAVELEWLDANPIRRVRRDLEPRGRVRFLSQAEQQRLLDACARSRDKRLYPLVVVALHTGARQGELLGLQWTDIDLDAGWAIVEDTKNGERRSLPLIGGARKALRAHAHDRLGGTRYVFEGRSGTHRFNKKAWMRALAEAGIEDFCFHDLRHTAASYLAMSGRSLVEIAEFLGHKTLAMVKRYSHLTEQHKADIARDMATRFLSDPGSRRTRSTKRTRE